MTRTAPAIPKCKFPSHSEPRVWLLSSGASPIGIALSRQLLAHGDLVVFGARPSDTSDTLAGPGADFTMFWTKEVLVTEGWKNRARVVALDGRCEGNLCVDGNMGQCQAAVAEVVTLFRRLDVLFCCSSQGVFNQNPLSTLIGRQYINSLAYEVAPFNIKVTIVQPNLEISILTNLITAAPRLPQYAPENNTAPLFREIIGSLLDRVDGTATTDRLRNGHFESGRFSSNEIVSVYPQLPEQTKSQLLAETVNALAAIGGHDNPPARHIVGHEAVASVKEKLKTVSEELEDFVEVSCAVDLNTPCESLQQGSGGDVQAP
ncbi:MAG: hypothetical protein Q9172_004827 [Xanthocarpia lactea]